MDFECEIRDLKRRVGDLEGALNVLTGQLGKIHPDIVLLGETTLQRFDEVFLTMDRMIHRLDTMNTQVWSLRDDMPSLLADAIRLSFEKRGDTA